MTADSARRLTLTLDNGPHPELTPQVLDTLAERSIRGTFFMVGAQAATPAGREVARQVYAAGHRIGNHTMTHTTPLGLRARNEAITEIRRADEVLAEFAGERPLFRPNGGGGRLGPHLFSPAAVDYLTAHGHTAVIWNCLPRDWEGPAGAWVDRALADLDSRRHSVIVLHDVLAETVGRLGAFLDAVRDRGIEITDELPEDCVVISDGRRHPALNGLVSQEPTTDKAL